MNNKIKCLICGLEFKRVCAHVRQAHGMTAREYKEEFGLDVSKGIMTDEDREIMRRHAYANGMDKQLREAGAKTRFSEGHSLGKYPRSQQTLKRLEQNRAKIIYKRKAWHKITCAECGTVFSVPEHRKDTAKYCSRHCSVINRNRIVAKPKE